MSLYISSTHNGSTFFHLVWVTYTIYAADRMNKRGSKIASRARQKSNYNPPSRGVGRCHLLLAAAANKWCARRKFKGSRKLGLVHLLPLLSPLAFHERRAEKAPHVHAQTVVVVVGSMVGGTALTLPAFNCVPERDPPGLDIRAGVMTREQEWRKKKNRGRRYRLETPRVRTYVLVDDVPGIVDQIDSNPRDEMRASIDLVKFDNISKREDDPNTRRRNVTEIFPFNSIPTTDLIDTPIFLSPNLILAVDQKI